MPYQNEKKFLCYSTELGRDKVVRVYLPTSYDGKKRFPVLYMHDGQNIVKKARLSRQSWDVTKTLSKLKKDIIVVGVDSDIHRTEDYYPYPMALKKGKPAVPSCADAYLDFLVDYVKPMIDHRYKTLSDPKHTYLAGSSLGGLITAYAALKKKGIFGVYGIFSIAFTMADDSFIKDYKRLGTDLGGRYYLAVGDREIVQGKGIAKRRGIFKEDYETYKQLLLDSGAKLSFDKVYKGAQHREIYWAKQFPDFAKLL